jgi:pyruvate dehydrogenase E2 component (dihydrolipoamide acetyltransferase)
MKKSILLTLALGLFTTFSPAAPKKTEEAKPTAAEAKKAAKEEAKPTAKAAAKEEVKPAVKKTTPKSKQKPEELSEADKALLAGAKKQVDALTATQKAKLLELANKGDIKALTTVDGVGEVKAKAIVDERPFTNGEDLIMVEGIGEGTFGNILTFVKGGQAKAEPKKEEKKAEPKTEKKEAPKADKTDKKEAPKTEKKKAA